MTIHLRTFSFKITSEEVLQGMWQLAFGWLPLLFPQPGDKRYKKVRQFNIVIPFKKQTAEAIALLFVGIVGGVYFGILANSGLAEPQRQLPVSAPQQIEKKHFTRSLPTHLNIPAVGISTELIQLGKNADGTLETPEEYQIAGWYKHSPTPGEIGPSVIVGHVDNYKGPAIFWGLKQLMAGDIIEVGRADGLIVKYQVENIKLVPQANFPTQEVYGNTDNAALRLITCGGVFNHQTGQYTDNIVVFASMIEA